MTWTKIVMLCPLVCVSTTTKQNIFYPTSVFGLFLPVLTDPPFPYENLCFLKRFRLSSELKCSKMPIETTVYDTFFEAVFKSVPFILCVFKNVHFLKPFSKASVYISVFSRFIVDDTQKSDGVKACLFKLVLKDPSKRYKVYF